MGGGILPIVKKMEFNMFYYLDSVDVQWKDSVNGVILEVQRRKKMNMTLQLEKVQKSQWFVWN